MNEHRQSPKILLSPVFLLCLFLLLLNDFFLKSYFHNALTGKLSDFAGLFVFPLFWAAFFPKRKLFIFAATAAFFVFWKSSYAGGFIEFWNNLGIFAIERTVDYSDLTALSVLPLAWIYGEKSEKLKFFATSAIVRKLALTCVAFVSLFAFTATSQAPKTSQFEEFEQVYKFDASALEIAKKLQEFKTEEFRQSKSGGTAYFNVRLHERVCDGLPDAGFTVSGGDKAEIKVNMILYQCDNRLPEHREKVRKMFESEVIGFLNGK